MLLSRANLFPGLVQHTNPQINHSLFSLSLQWQDFTTGDPFSPLRFFREHTSHPGAEESPDSDGVPSGTVHHQA